MDACPSPLVPATLSFWRGAGGEVLGWDEVSTNYIGLSQTHVKKKYTALKEGFVIGNPSKTRIP